MSSRLQINVRGAVQGMGFRPFIWRLATEMGLSGWVRNDGRGVEIAVEGSTGDLELFADRLVQEGPAAARIQGLERGWCAARGESGFEIHRSDRSGELQALVLPDLATCSQCLEEIWTAGERRHRYPFTNCTVCGPRYTIIESVPYDRVATTMAGFALCADCRREYDDPRDRRFHAQPVACPRCGPVLRLLDPGGHEIASRDVALEQTAAALAQGRIVAVKGLGGYHLMCDATCSTAIARLRTRKHRPHRPLALMVRDVEMARALCDLTPEVIRELQEPAAPLILVPRKQDSALPAALAPDTDTLALMLPATPLHHLLLAAVDGPVVATSGNPGDEPICIDDAEAMTRLAGIPDLLLAHDRPIARPVDDSIGWMLQGSMRLLRRARGYAPQPVSYQVGSSIVLGLGGQLKNAVALGHGSRVFLSQHIGDLHSAPAQDAHERATADLIRLHGLAPDCIAHDLHPDYASTHLALRLERESRTPITLVPVQHHHAHLASCLADAGAAGPALGVTWDGAGLGADGTIWGGEFLHGDARAYRRVGHLWPFMLPGGERVMREPWRAALALLWELHGPEAFGLTTLPPLLALAPADRPVIRQMLEGSFASPTTSSAGRLFDGVSSLLGLHQRVTFEGQASMALERHAGGLTPGRYHCPLREVEGGWCVDWRPMLRELLADLAGGVSTRILARRFHSSLVDAIVEVATRVACEQVALTGGCFQNRLLCEGACSSLSAAGFRVLLHRNVPPGDGGLALGQVAVATSVSQELRSTNDD